MCTVTFATPLIEIIPDNSTCLTPEVKSIAIQKDFHLMTLSDQSSFTAMATALPSDSHLTTDSGLPSKEDEYVLASEAVHSPCDTSPPKPESEQF